MNSPIISVGDAPKLQAKDFASGAEVKWCPGCGSFAILSTLEQVLAGLNVPKHEHVFVSGIGCSSRTPYYLSTYGFHTIHGRAMAVATGVKLANPKLTVWVITGDGDALSIGGNHFLHTLRRNVDIKVLLFNNRIYGLTKGQASPTSERGKVTKSSPHGTVEAPVNPAALALATGATFVARSLAVDRPTLTAVLKEAAAHKGSALIEILQSCVVFNEGAYDELWDKDSRDGTVVNLREGEPLYFGKQKELVVTFDDHVPSVRRRAELSASPVSFSASNPVLASAVAALPLGEFPLPVGILYRCEQETFDGAVHKTIAAASSRRQSFEQLLNEGETWEVG